MEILSSLLTGNSDNLYKFLCINGLLLILISIFYPLNKKNEIELLNLQNEHQIKVFNFHTDLINKDVVVLEKEVDNGKKSIIQLRENQKKYSLKRNKYEIEINQIKNNISIKNKNLDSLFFNQSIKKIEIEGHQKKIKKLEEQALEFKTIYNWFMCIGIASFVIGFIWWVVESIKKEKKLSNNQ